jgi:hypothetical protein
MSCCQVVIVARDRIGERPSSSCTLYTIESISSLRVAHVHPTEKAGNSVRLRRCNRSWKLSGNCIDSVSLAPQFTEYM